VAEHYLTKYGTTHCPENRVAAEIDQDGECSSCGSGDIVSEEQPNAPTKPAV
jgi:hypothetical protein